MENKYKEYGGQIISERKEAVRSEYIDSQKRKKLISEIARDAVQQGQDRSGLRSAVDEAKRRNENFIKSEGLKDSPSANEYRELRKKQLELSEEEL